MIVDQGELGLIIEEGIDKWPRIIGYKTPDNNLEKFSKEELVDSYLLATLETCKYTDRELDTLSSHFQTKFETFAHKSMLTLTQVVKKCKKQAVIGTF